MGEITGELLEDRLVIAAATPGPWFVHNVGDHMCMNAYTVACTQEAGELDDFKNIIAITLLQEPRFADVTDSRWQSNAEFIARARERWPLAVERVLELERELKAVEAENADLRRRVED